MACYISVRILSIRFGRAKNLVLQTVTRMRASQPHLTRGFALFLLLAFCLSVGTAARAQDSLDDSSIDSSSVSPNVITLASPTKTGRPQSPFAGRSPLPWQVSVGYQFNHINVRGTLIPFNTIGVNASVVRYIVQGIGVEAAAGGGYGIAQLNAKAGTLFVGAGVHLIYMNRTRFEPWAHGLIGGATLNLGHPIPAKTGTPAWIAGGGVDYRISPRLAVRIQADYLGTHYWGAFQRNLQIVGGFVWNL
jgi:hypothetical protein